MKITVYTKPGCVPCKGVRRWLDRRDIEYDEVDASTDHEAQRFLVSRNFLSAPITQVTYHNGEEEFIESFRPDELSAAILTDVQS